MSGILIVEDNLQVRRLIKSEVEGFTDELYETDDGVSALEFYQKYHPDWVLMDLEMKQVDGLTATRQIVAEDKRAKICIVTNYDDEFLREEAFQAGACGYIVKSDLHQLQTVLKVRT